MSSRPRWCSLYDVLWFLGSVRAVSLTHYTNPYFRVSGGSFNAAEKAMDRGSDGSMLTLPAIAQDREWNGLNGGPRYCRRNHFTSLNYGRFYRDNSMEAKAREQLMDAKGRERARLRRAAAEERRRRREIRLRAIEKNVRREEKRLSELERTLPPIRGARSDDNLALPGLNSRERAAISAQKACRRWLAKQERRRRERAAHRMQLRARSFVTGRVAAKQRAESRAAVQLQCKARATAACRATANLRLQNGLHHAQAKRLQRLVAATHRRKIRRAKAAVSLQSLTRGRQARNRLHELRKLLGILKMAVHLCRAAKRAVRRLRAGRTIAICGQTRFRGARGRKMALVRLDYWKTRKRLTELDTDAASLLFLHAHNLADAYDEKWRAIAVDGPTLACVLDEEDFSELGVSMKVHRRRLLRAVSAIKREGVPMQQLALLAEERDKIVAAAAAESAAAAATKRREMTRARALQKTERRLPLRQPPGVEKAATDKNAHARSRKKSYRPLVAANQKIGAGLPRSHMRDHQKRRAQPLRDDKRRAPEEFEDDFEDDGTENVSDLFH